jgi:thiol:disulfide interchange protein
VLALYMFGLFTITVPSSIAAKSGSGRGHTGAVAMGFLAAILSTPCSFAILAAAFAWAQTQPLQLATIAIMVIGIGMALPYAILTSMPRLLKRLPKAGRWMELFKQAIGFILLIIAVKLIAALPQVRRINVLYFAVVLGFSIWMWSTWVSYSTKALRRWLVRIIAVALAVAAGWLFLAGPENELIDWQDYNTDLIDEAAARSRPVLIKFTADWCLSCQTVEKVVYSREDISQLIEQKNVLAIKADTTERNSPATLALKNIYNEPGVPVSILLIPGRYEPLKWQGILFADELKKALQELASEKKDGEKAED